jgi:hypothetical protein
MIPTQLSEQAQNKIEQLQNSQRLLSAKIELWQQKLRALGEKGAREREVTQAVAQHFQTLASDASNVLNVLNHTLFPKGEVRAYIEAHKSFEDAEAGLMSVQIAELQAQHTINQVALERLQPAEKKIQSPGGIIRPS